MLWTVLKREIQDYIRTSKFLIGVLITIVLVTSSTIININDYKQRNQDYFAAREATKNERFYIQVYRAPEVLSAFVQGKERKLGNKLQMTYLHLPSRTSGYMGVFASQHHRFLAGFAAIDFAFTVRVILSLLVLFLAYNSISGEKFNGTLKLILSNRIPRDQILLGKFLGGLFVIFSALVLAALLSVIIMVIHPAISPVNGDFIRIFAMLGTSFLYLICFFTLSLLVSVAINRPAISLMVLLQIWIFLIIIYPNLGIIIAENTYKLPSNEEVTEQKKAAFQSYEAEYKSNREAFNNAIHSGGRPSEEVSRRHTELCIKKAEVEHQVAVDFSWELTQQMQLAFNLSIFTPAVLYDQAMQRFARTDIRAHEKFLEGTERHWQKHTKRQLLRHQDKKAYRESKLSDFTYPRESFATSLNSCFPAVFAGFITFISGLDRFHDFDSQFTRYYFRGICECA